MLEVTKTESQTMLELTNAEELQWGKRIAVKPQLVAGVAEFVEQTGDDEDEPTEGCVVTTELGAEYFVQEDYDEIMQQLSELLELLP